MHLSLRRRELVEEAGDLAVPRRGLGLRSLPLLVKLCLYTGDLPMSMAREQASLFTGAHLTRANDMTWRVSGGNMRRLSPSLTHLEGGDISLAVCRQARELALQQLFLLQRVSQRRLHLPQPAQLPMMLRSERRKESVGFRLLGGY